MNLTSVPNPAINLYPNKKNLSATEKLLDGNKSNILAEVRKNSQSKNETLLVTLKKLYQQKKSAIIDLDKKHLGIFYLNAKLNVLYIRVSNNNIKTICKNNLSVSYRELEKYSFESKKITNIRVKVHLDRFIWVVSIITSKSYLPDNIDINKSRLSLKHWPNLSRYKNIPNAVRLAAFFSQTPTSVTMASKMLSCSTEDVTTFINACDALDLLEIDLHESMLNKLTHKISDEKRGFLSGILKRLIG